MREPTALDRFEAPEKESVLNACERIGYGRVMQIASDAWRELDPIGALTVGPCAIALTKPADPPASAGLPQAVENLIAIFKRDEVMDAMCGHCSRTHLDEHSYEICEQCNRLRVVLIAAITSLSTRPETEETR